MPPPTDAEKQQRLKAALWYSVGQTIDSVSLAKDINATPHYIGALSEMLWGQIGTEGTSPHATKIYKPLISIAL
jgi:centromere protein S